MDISKNSESHKNEEFLAFWKVETKEYEFPMNLNITMELLGFPVF